MDSNWPIRLRFFCHFAASIITCSTGGTINFLVKCLLTYLLTYLLIPWTRVLLEKLTGSQLVKKFPAFYELRRFITAYARALHLSLSWASSIRLLRSYQSISPGPRVSVWILRNTIRFYGEELLARRPTPKLENHPLSAVRDCLFNIYAATLHIGGRSSTRNLRTRHAAVTGTHLSRCIKFLLHKFNIVHFKCNYIIFIVYQYQRSAVYYFYIG